MMPWRLEGGNGGRSPAKRNLDAAWTPVR